MENYNPPLSIVATSRNDDHGGNLLQRMQLFVNGIISQSRLYNLKIELILVDWNPPYDKPKLAQALVWPKDAKSCCVRIIEVPPEIHKHFRDSDKLPLFQMLAKNVGIRRSRGKFVLATNIDILFSDELMQYMASGRLNERYFYRVDRSDVFVGDISENVSHDIILEACKQNVIRICEREGIHDLRTGNYFPIRQRQTQKLKLNEIRQDWGLAPITDPSPLYTNACGDFTLMSRYNWFNLCGYPELEVFSFHLDSLLLHAAYHSGLKERILENPMKIYHIEHAIGSGWSPEGQEKLEHRIDSAGIRRISNKEFKELTIRMRREKRPTLFSGKDWGLANRSLPEISIYPESELEVVTRPITASFTDNLPTGSSPHEQQKSFNQSKYRIVNPKSKLGENPIVSVVVPSLNRADYLFSTIESILNQNYQNIECIVVDGGSTDGTLEILESYGNRIKWVSEPDKGHVDAIAKGWRMCKGEILAWLNADDVWEVPGAVDQVVKYLKENPIVSIVYGECGRIDAEGNLIGMSYSHEWSLEYAVMYCDHCIPQPAAFIKRDILEKVGWLDTDFYSKKDHELWLRIGLNGEIRRLPVLLAYARKIEGLSQQGGIVAKSCVQVTRKFYSLPNVPPNLKRKKRFALSNSYLKGSEYAFAGGRHWKMIISYAFFASIISPGNSINVFRYLFRILRAGANEGIYDHRAFYQKLWVMIDTALRPVTFSRETLQKIVWNIKGVGRPRMPNLLGDRDIEWSWIAAQMPSGPGEALDFGPGGSSLSLIATMKGYKVTAVDLQEINPPYWDPNLRFVEGDILKIPMAQERFDLVINCSSVEHVGMAGRYGVTKNVESGDLEVMKRLRELMKPEGVMLFTIPVGRDAVFAPFCRVYGKVRLPQLVEGYRIEKESYWVKGLDNRWVLSGKKEALNFNALANSPNPLRNMYALGCFVLKNQ